MTIMRMAMIQPQTIGKDSAMSRRGATNMPEGSSRPRKSADAVPGGTCRRAIIEGYPIAGLALIFAFFARTLLLGLQLAD